MPPLQENEMKFVQRVVPSPTLTALIRGDATLYEAFKGKAASVIGNSQEGSHTLMLPEDIAIQFDEFVARFG